MHVYDDHEIANDWDYGAEEPYPAALVPFETFHAAENPAPLVEGGYYASLMHEPAEFVLLDMGQYRDASIIESRLCCANRHESTARRALQRGHDRAIDFVSSCSCLKQTVLHPFLVTHVRNEGGSKD